MQSPVEMLDYEALASAPVATAPFAHIVLPDFVPPAALAAVHADFPDSGRGGSFPPEALAFGPAARALFAEMQRPRLRQAIAEKFALDLAEAPTMLTARLHCREKDGQIHTDSAAKRVTVLLYLNPPTEPFLGAEGSLRLLLGPDDLEAYGVEVPPTRGTLLVFPNGPATWHGHPKFVGRRCSVQLNYMTNDGRARSELRRHKLSAFVKQLV